MMQLKVFYTLWGDAGVQPARADFERIAAAGYDGIEVDAPQVRPAEFLAWRREFGLDYIGMLYPFRPEEIRPQVEQLLAFEPRQLTMHSGRDKMTFDEGCRFLEEALRVEADTGVPIAHETHRHRLFFSPWSTAQYCEQFPELRLCADFSHWCTVCECMLADMDDWVGLACERAIHVHGRVGHEEGPQVSDPRAPEFAERLAIFEGWWDRVRAAHARRGAAAISFDPEYGPPAYLPTLPYTRQPVADLWELRLWAAERIRGRWA